MKGATSDSAITKIQTAGLIVIVLVAATAILFASAPKRPGSQPYPFPTATNTLTNTPTSTTSLGPTPSSSSPAPSSTDLSNPRSEILIGVEYVSPGTAETFSSLGIPAVKPLPGSFSWDQMQRSPEAPIDFSFTDKYVKEFQGAGFTVMVFGLKVSNNIFVDPWMIDPAYPKSQAISPKYYDDYRSWVRSLVERYDKDGKDDMAGLKYPVKYYEVGVEFSSYQPEPTEVYLKTLEQAYKAAHEASNQVVVGHSAFLLSGVFANNPTSSQYEAAFSENLVGTEGKGLSDIHMVLNRPDLFDVLNVHNLGWPYEIERIVKWLSYELAQRGYDKPVIISDTSPTSFAGFGSATSTVGSNLAVMDLPATEADRGRLAEYFKKLISADSEYIAWLRNYLAADTVQRVVIAAEQGAELIDTAFTGDLPGAASALFQAAAGNAGWGGMVDFEGMQVTGKRPAFYALQQLQSNIKGYHSVVRVNVEDEEVRLYKVTMRGREFFIAWFGYQHLYLPDDPMPVKNVQINVETSQVIIENLKMSTGVTRTTTQTAGGILFLTLTPEPIYIFNF